MATIQDALRYFQGDVSNSPEFNNYWQMFGDPPDDQSWWVGPDGQLTPQAQQWFTAAQNAGNQQKDAQAAADKDSKLGDLLKLGGIALGGYGLLSGLGGLGAAAGSFGTTLGDAGLGAMAGLGETGGLVGLGDAGLGAMSGLGEGGGGLTASLSEYAAPTNFLNSGADYTADWASQGGGVDPSTWQLGGSDAGAGSPYANWASQGGGVDPGTTVFPGSSGGGGGGIWDTVKGFVKENPWVVPAAGSALTGGLGYLGASKVADAQQKAASDQQGLLKYIYDQNRADLEPWRQAGVGALGNLVNLTTPGKQFDQMALDPGYQFRLSQGELGINRAAASRGGYDSGGTLKALQRFGQDYASNEFGNVYNRNANLAGLGQTAVGQGLQSSQNYGQQTGDSMLQSANARASGYMGGANAIAGGIGSFLNNYNQQTLLDKMLGGKM